MAGIEDRLEREKSWRQEVSQVPVPYHRTRARAIPASQGRR